MTATANTDEPSSAQSAPRAVGIIDADVHPALPHTDALSPYLSARWRRHAETYGTRTQHGLATGSAYKPLINGGVRGDAWPESGGPPGSDLTLMREQLLDAYGIECGVLSFLNPIASQLNLDYGAALARAANDWQLEAFVEPEPRLKLSMVVPYEDPPASVAEIERLAGHPGVSSIMLLSRSLEPMGRRRYWPIFEAAERHGLPIGMHLSEIGGHPNTSSGFASYYAEYHVAHTQAFQAQLLSLIFEGVFDRFPRLKFVFLEGGLAWVPAFLQRCDHSWERLHSELPNLDRRPSEYAENHLWCAAQPIDEPEDPGQLVQIFREWGMEKVLFSSDYPHWDFDSPTRSLPRGLTGEEREQILGGNARCVYDLPSPR